METIKNLEITDTAYGGYGVGRSPDGRVVFVARTVTGDFIDCKITEDKKQFVYAELLDIKTASPLRRQALCPYFNKCGGCLFAHILDEAQISIKENIIRNAFRKYPHAGFDIIVHKSLSEGYRIRSTLRMKDGNAGFFAFKTNDFIKVENCRIMKKSLFDKVYKFIKSNKVAGEIYAIETPDNIALAAIKTDEESVLLNIDIFDGATINKKTYGLKDIGYPTANGVVGVSAGSFFQANAYLMDEFQTLAVSKIDHGLSVTELYAGSGFFTCGIMKNSSDVKGAEMSQEAAALAKKYGYPIKKQDAGEFLASLKKSDIIFLDPPRDGVSNSVIDNIKRLKPIKIIYVSCNPTTLARDVIKLSDSYRVDSFDMFDMFPDTFHIESVVVLKRVL